MKDECNAVCVKIVAGLIVGKEGTNTLIFYISEYGAQYGAEYSAKSGAI